MSSLNDKQLTAYAFNEATAREKHLALKLEAIGRSTRNVGLRKLCIAIMAASRSRLTILRREMENLNIN